MSSATKIFQLRQAVALSLMLTATASGWAQDASTTEVNADRGLEEIIVTAQRVSETLQDAALPIDVASGERLAILGVPNASGLNKVSPSLYVSTGGGANTAYFVRGVGNFTNNGYTAPAIAFNIDGVYVGRASSTTTAFLDLNRVEVLKGPQGTLYGRNSTGGAINIIPNTPVLNENSGSVLLGFGDYSATEASAVLNYAPGENSAIRFAAAVTGRDGYFDDGTDEAEDVAVRAQFYTEFSERVRLRLAADYADQSGSGPGALIHGLHTFAPFQSAQPVPNWPFIALAGDEFAGLHHPATLQFIEDNATAAPLFSPLVDYAYPFRDDRYYGANAELNISLGESELVIIPSYRFSKLNNQFNGPPFKNAINEDEAEQYSVEARLTGSVTNFDYIVGAYLFDESVEGVQFLQPVWHGDVQ